jgi:chemotaxis protein methyltransferase CheR
VTRAGVLYRRPSTELGPASGLSWEARRPPLPEQRPQAAEDAFGSGAALPPRLVNEARATAEGTPGPPPPDTPAAGTSEAAAALALARAALAAGDYNLAVQLAGRVASPAAAAISVQARANREGAGAAAEHAAEAARQHPLSVELHFLHAVLLAEAGREADAMQAVRRTLYLDRSFAPAHLLLGTLLRTRGDLAGARRACRTAAKLAGGGAP